MGVRVVRIGADRRRLLDHALEDLDVAHRLPAELLVPGPQDRVRGAAGDRLALGRRDDEYPGWVWATAADALGNWTRAEATVTVTAAGKSMRVSDITLSGTVKGSVINLRDSALTMAGTSDIIIESQGTSNHPAGVFFGSHYSPLPVTYQEITENE